jgi:hypothetical protein
VTVPWTVPAAAPVNGIVHVPAHNTPMKLGHREDRQALQNRRERFGAGKGGSLVLNRQLRVAELDAADR